MKTIYKSICITLFGIIPFSLSAQKDTTLVRQVLLEREYNPTLQDASKINTVPAIYNPIVKTSSITFIHSVPQLSIKNNQLGAVSAGRIQTNIDYDTKKGYLTMGVGTRANIQATAGYRILNTETDQLDIFADHSSMNGNVDYVQKGYSLKNVKAKYADTKVKLKFQHRFDPATMYIDGSFFNTNYNYYGNPFLPADVTNEYMFSHTHNQNVDVINLGAGLMANEDNLSPLKYKGNIRYRNFKTKYGAVTSVNGMKGGQLDLDVDVNTVFGDDKHIGIKGYIMNQSLNNKKETDLEKIAFHNFTDIQATPYIKFEGENWHASLGLNVNTLFDQKNNMFLSPDIFASVNVSERSQLYAQIAGGINNNTYLEILQENRYVNPTSRVEYSKTVYDAKVGFKSGVVEGLEFDIFGGYNYTKKDHLYLYSPSADLNTDTTHFWANVASPIYADLSTGHIGGLVKTNLIPYSNLSARLIGYFYNVKYTDSYYPAYFSDITEKKAWGRPTFTAELNWDMKPIDQFTISMNYLFAGGRKTYVKYPLSTSTSVENMNNINELNFKGEYQLMDWLSFNFRLNNLLFQKYELVYGYPIQGFHILGGASLKF